MGTRWRGWPTCEGWARLVSNQRPLACEASGAFEWPRSRAGAVKSTALGAQLRPRRFRPNGSSFRSMTPQKVLNSASDGVQLILDRIWLEAGESQAAMPALAGFRGVPPHLEVGRGRLLQPTAPDHGEPCRGRLGTPVAPGPSFYLLFRKSLRALIAARRSLACVALVFRPSPQRVGPLAETDHQVAHPEHQREDTQHPPKGLLGNPALHRRPEVAANQAARS